MARTIAATPIVRGKDAKRIFGVMRVAKKMNKAALVRRSEKLSKARSIFKKVGATSKVV